MSSGYSTRDCCDKCQKPACPGTCGEEQYTPERVPAVGAPLRLFHVSYKPVAAPRRVARRTGRRTARRTARRTTVDAESSSTSSESSS